MGKWVCTRCSRDKATITAKGCGMPDYFVPVPYAHGWELARPACPLTYHMTLRGRLWAFLKRMASCH